MTPCRLCGLLLAVVLVGGEGAAQLPPDIEADRYLVEAERHSGTGDHASAKVALDRILALQAAHELVLPEAFWFKYAQVAYQAGLDEAVVEAATRYLTTVGREGAHYQEALELLDRAAARAEEQRRAAAAARAAAERRRQAAEAERRRLAQLPREIRNSIGIELVLLEAGTFAMGSPPTEAGRDADEGPVHEVTISQRFYLGKYEVTQGQWQAVMGEDRSFAATGGGAISCSNCAASYISWADAQAFIAALNRREGVETYRLPTEAEWEYAARAGTQTAYHFGDAAGELDRYAWYGELLLLGGVHPVGQKRPNAWGLYDMHGNVWEWVADWKGQYPQGPVTDPRGPSTGVFRVIRGGGWDDSARLCRVANRNRGATRTTGYYTNDRGSGTPNEPFQHGFRLARTP